MKQVKYIEKKGYNKFHKYKFATESDVNEKVREELAKVNVIMIPNMEHHETREHENRSGNTEYIVTVDMSFRFIDGETGEEITFKMSGSGQDAGDKAIMKAISAAQKYALMKAFMIPTGDDPEADEGVDERNHGTQPQKQQYNTNTPPRQQNSNTSQNKASDKQLKFLNTLITRMNDELGYDRDQVKDVLSKKSDVGAFTSTKDMTGVQASASIKHLQNALGGGQ